jgi:RNA polymerase sigma-70 factor (ECF subfamily)
MRSDGGDRVDDARLSAALQRAGSGDKDAFAELYQRFYRRVFGLCRYLLGSAEEAEDATADVFSRLENTMRTYDRAQPFPRWLLSVANHHCLDLLRKRRLEQRLFEPLVYRLTNRLTIG